MLKRSNWFLRFLSWRLGLSPEGYRDVPSDVPVYEFIWWATKALVVNIFDCLWFVLVHVIVLLFGFWIFRNEWGCGDDFKKIPYWPHIRGFPIAPGPFLLLWLAYQVLRLAIRFWPILALVVFLTLFNWLIEWMQKPNEKRHHLLQNVRHSLTALKSRIPKVKIGD